MEKDEAFLAAGAIFRAVLDFSGPLQTAKEIMQQKLDWQRKKAFLDQQLREQASDDMDSWEIPREHSGEIIASVD